MGRTRHKGPVIEDTLTKSLALRVRAQVRLEATHRSERGERSAAERDSRERSGTVCVCVATELARNTIQPNLALASALSYASKSGCSHRRCPYSRPLPSSSPSHSKGPFAFINPRRRLPSISLPKRETTWHTLSTPRPHLHPRASPIPAGSLDSVQQWPDSAPFKLQ